MPSVETTIFRSTQAGRSLACLNIPCRIENIALTPAEVRHRTQRRISYDLGLLRRPKKTSLSSGQVEAFVLSTVNPRGWPDGR